jgi:hypothetical protein
MEGLRDSKELQEYILPDGTAEEGVLLSRDEYERLIDWWDHQTTPPPAQRRGRRTLHPSLFGNPYKSEFEEEKQKILKARGKGRGATKEAITTLAKRHRVEFDTMRKRIKGS